MEQILDKVDFDKYTVYDIQINVIDSYNFETSKESENELGQSNDVISRVRRTIKYSFPFDEKKIINEINVEDEKEDENEELCRNLAFRYYLLVETENIDEFDTEELHDELEEEWRSGSSECNITISLYEK